MSLHKSIKWYYSRADLIWPDGPFTSYIFKLFEQFLGMIFKNLHFFTSEENIVALRLNF
jgi:hypothetical protein